MPVYSSGSRRPGRPSRAFRLAYFDARPRAGIQAVYDGRCSRDEAAQEVEEAAAPSRAELELVIAELDQILQRRSSTAYGPYYDSASFDDLREAVTTLTKAARISKRVLGGAHPLAAVINEDLGESKDALQLKKDFSG